MDIIAFLMLLFYCSLIIGSKGCRTRRCNFKVNEISIPRRRINFHICGNQLPSTVYHFCSRPRPSGTKRPETMRTTSKSTTHTPPLISTTLRPPLAQTTSGMVKPRTALPSKTALEGNQVIKHHYNSSQSDNNGTQAYKTSRTIIGNRTVLTSESVQSSPDSASAATHITLPESQSAALNAHGM